ncbi:putative protein OS=Streptomyces griseomycini OX=66895 GN=FHS37_003430 PE=4 SV=1 [Streptomyces griseomycini]|uniref:Uncharacterized protein n=1 Tax=Streptomyces griseomycini TaxID=66895 RepID=A0A7W7LZJ0_9ACTN|nr:hypothetical protein [Streptomyces griseomycini]
MLLPAECRGGCDWLDPVRAMHAVRAAADGTGRLTVSWPR